MSKLKRLVLLFNGARTTPIESPTRTLVESINFRTIFTAGVDRKYSIKLSTAEVIVCRMQNTL